MNFEHPGVILWKRKTPILLASLLCGAIAAVAAFILPVEYRATTLVVPALKGSRGPNLGELSANLMDLGIAAVGQGANTEVFAPIVKSRQLLTAVLNLPFRVSADDSTRTLLEFLDIDGTGNLKEERGVARLRDDLAVDLDRRTGVLSVTFRSKSPYVAAGVANAIDSLLQDFLVRSASRQASANRRFIEGRLRETESLLMQSEEDLTRFRQENVRLGGSSRLQLQEQRLIRAVHQQEELYLTLLREYESSRIEELRDVPVLTVIDPAAVPAVHSWPKRKLIVLLGVLIGLAISSVIVVWRSAPNKVPTTPLAPP